MSENQSESFASESAASTPQKAHASPPRSPSPHVNNTNTYGASGNMNIFSKPRSEDEDESSASFAKSGEATPATREQLEKEEKEEGEEVREGAPTAATTVTAAADTNSTADRPQEGGGDTATVAKSRTPSRPASSASSASSPAKASSNNSRASSAKSSVAASSGGHHQHQQQQEDEKTVEGQPQQRRGSSSRSRSNSNSSNTSRDSRKSRATTSPQEPVGSKPSPTPPSPSPAEQQHQNSVARSDDAHQRRDDEEEEADASTLAALPAEEKPQPKIPASALRPPSSEKKTKKDDDDDDDRHSNSGGKSQTRSRSSSGKSRSSSSNNSKRSDDHSSKKSAASSRKSSVSSRGGSHAKSRSSHSSGGKSSHRSSRSSNGGKSSHRSHSSGSGGRSNSNEGSSRRTSRSVSSQRSSSQQSKSKTPSPSTSRSHSRQQHLDNKKHAEADSGEASVIKSTRSEDKIKGAAAPSVANKKSTANGSSGGDATSTKAAADPKTKARSTTTVDNNSTDGKKQKEKQKKEKTPSSVYAQKRDDPDALHNRNLLSDEDVARIRAAVERSDASSVRRQRAAEKQKFLGAAIATFGKEPVSVVHKNAIGGSNKNRSGSGRRRQQNLHHSRREKSHGADGGDAFSDGGGGGGEGSDGAVAVEGRDGVMVVIGGSGKQMLTTAFSGTTTTVTRLVPSYYSLPRLATGRSGSRGGWRVASAGGGGGLQSSQQYFGQQHSPKLPYVERSTFSYVNSPPPPLSSSSANNSQCRGGEEGAADEQGVINDDGESPSRALKGSKGAGVRPMSTALLASRGSTTTALTSSNHQQASGMVIPSPPRNINTAGGGNGGNSSSAPLRHSLRSPYLSRNTPLTTYDTLFMPSPPPSATKMPKQQGTDGGEGEGEPPHLKPISPSRLPSPRAGKVVALRRGQVDKNGRHHHIIYEDDSAYYSQQQQQHSLHTTPRNASSDDGAGEATDSSAKRGTSPSKTASYVPKSSASNPYSTYGRFNKDGVHFSRRPAPPAHVTEEGDGDTTGHGRNSNKASAARVRGGGGGGGGKKRQNRYASHTNSDDAASNHQHNADFADGTTTAAAAADDSCAADSHEGGGEGGGRGGGGTSSEAPARFKAVWTLPCSLLTQTYAKVLAKSEDFARRQIREEQIAKRNQIKQLCVEAQTIVANCAKLLQDLCLAEDKARCDGIAAAEREAWARLEAAAVHSCALAKCQEEVFPTCKVLVNRGDKAIIEGSAHGSMLIEVRWSGVGAPIVGGGVDSSASGLNANSSSADRSSSVIPCVLMYSRDNRLCLSATGDETLRCPKSGLPLLRSWGEFVFEGRNKAADHDDDDENSEHSDGSDSDAESTASSSHSSSGSDNRTSRSSSSSSSSSAQQASRGNNATPSKRSRRRKHEKHSKKDAASSPRTHQRLKSASGGGGSTLSNGQHHHSFELLLHNLAPSLGVRKIFIVLLPPAKSGATLQFLRRAYLTVKVPEKVEASKSGVKKYASGGGGGNSPSTSNAANGGGGRLIHPVRLLPDSVLNDQCAISIGRYAEMSPALAVASLVAGPAEERLHTDPSSIHQLHAQLCKHRARAAGLTAGGGGLDSSGDGGDYRSSIKSILTAIDVAGGLVIDKPSPAKPRDEKNGAADGGKGERNNDQQSSRASSRANSSRASSPEPNTASSPSSPAGVGVGASSPTLSPSSPSSASVSTWIAQANNAAVALSDAVATTPWAVVNVLRSLDNNVSALGGGGSNASSAADAPLTIAASPLSTPLVGGGSGGGGGGGVIITQRTLAKKMEALFLLSEPMVMMQCVSDYHRIAMLDLNLWEKSIRDRIVGIDEVIERRAMFDAFAERLAEEQRNVLRKMNSGGGHLGAPTAPNASSSSSSSSRRVSSYN